MTLSVKWQAKKWMPMEPAVQRGLSRNLIARFVVLAAFLFSNMPLLSGQSDALYINDKGNVGIGTQTPGYPLTFPNTMGDKISLFGQSGAHYGFGVQTSLFQIYSDNVKADVVFGYGKSDSLTETMRIKGSGFVGIGTKTPAFPLSFSDVNGDKIALSGQSGPHYGLGVQPSLLQVQTPDAKSDIAFGYGPSDKFTETMRIAGVGDVNLNSRMFLLGRSRGTVSVTNNAYLDEKGAWQIKDTAKKAFTMELRDSSVLEFFGTLTNGKTDWRKIATFDAANNKTEFPGSDSKVVVGGKLFVAGGISFYWGPRKTWYTIEHGSGGKGGSISVASGDSTGPSDLRLKKDVEPIQSALAKVNQLRGVTFHWNEQGLQYLTRDIATSVSAGPGASDMDDEKARQDERAEEYKELSVTNIGVVAQDVENVLPEAVTTDASGYKSVNYHELIPLMVEALKEENRLTREQAQTIARQQSEIRQLSVSSQAAEQQLADVQVLKQQLVSLEATVARMTSPAVRAASMAQTHSGAHSTRSQ